MRQVGVLEAKTHFSSLLDSIERDGQEITITRHGRVVAQLVPPRVDAAEHRRLTGPEMLERSKAFREEIARRNPDIGTETWEELKEIARR